MGDSQRKVGPLETADALEWVAQFQDRADVGTHLWCRSRGECPYLRCPDLFDRCSEPEVVGAKIVSPLGEAVRLVNGEEADRALRTPIDPDDVIDACGPVPGRVPVGGDCDDADPAIGSRVWHVDQDGDTYGDPVGAIVQCAPVAGRILEGGENESFEALVSLDRRSFLAIESRLVNGTYRCWQLELQNLEAYQ